MRLRRDLRGFLAGDTGSETAALVFGIGILVLGYLGEDTPALFLGPALLVLYWVMQSRRVVLTESELVAGFILRPKRFMYVHNL